MLYADWGYAGAPPQPVSFGLAFTEYLGKMQNLTSEIERFISYFRNEVEQIWAFNVEGGGHQKAYKKVLFFAVIDSLSMCRRSDSCLGHKSGGGASVQLVKSMCRRSDSCRGHHLNQRLTTFQVVSPFFFLRFYPAPVPLFFLNQLKYEAVTNKKIGLTTMGEPSIFLFGLRRKSRE
jgi:hypothetical protein